MHSSFSKRLSFEVNPYAILVMMVKLTFRCASMGSQLAIIYDENTFDAVNQQTGECILTFFGITTYFELIKVKKLNCLTS